MNEFTKQENELKGATFAPQIAPSAFPLQNFKPIQERYKEVQQYKEQLLINLKKKFQDKQKTTFKPTLDKQTERLAVHRNGGRDVLERLQEEAEEINNKKLHLLMQEERKIAEECPFHPNLDHFVNDEVHKLHSAA